MNGDEYVYNNAEREIDFRQLLYVIIRRWRLLLCLALTGAVLACLFTLMVRHTARADQALLAESRRKYEASVLAHESLGESLRQDIAGIQLSMAQQEAYNSDSLLMQIDPYNACTASIIYYVDSGYQINPALTYQNIDYGRRLVKLYASYLTGGEAYTQLAQGLDAPVDIRYIIEAMQVAVDYSTNMITVTLRSKSEDACRKMLEILKAGMKAVHEGAQANIGAHMLSAVSEYVYQQVDLALEKTQRAHIAYIATLAQMLGEKNEALIKWEKSPVPEWQFDDKTMLKDLIKAALIGVAAAVFLGCCALAAGLIFSGKINGANEAQALTNLSVFGTLPPPPPPNTGIRTGQAGGFRGQCAPAPV